MKQTSDTTLFSLVQQSFFAGDRPFEVVERKGLGHPDTLADGLAEEISIAYSRFTEQKFGAVLHHHVDKLYIRGGEWRIAFGAAEMVKPVRVIVNGRFSLAFGKEPIPVQELAEEVSRRRLAKVLPHLDSGAGIGFVHLDSDASHTKRWYRPESMSDLPDASHSWANDTAVCVGYHPLTVAEVAALQAEAFFYVAPFTPRYPHIGQDIKVMVVRQHKRLFVTICIPFISLLTADQEFYFGQQAEIRDSLGKFLEAWVPPDYSVEVFVNTSDANPYRSHMYLSAVGSCIDSGEEGVVGRGNGTSGIISSFRPYSMEAAFGKNPTYHTGRIYGVLARGLAQHVSEQLSQATTVTVVTQNGRPLKPPFALNVEISGSANESHVKEMCYDYLTDTDVLSAVLSGALVPRSWHHFEQIT